MIVMENDTLMNGLDTGEVGSELSGQGTGTQTEDITSSPKPYDIPEDAFVSVKVGGEDKVLPWKEARSGVMFQSAFTKKTQELAEQRRAFEARQAEIERMGDEYSQRSQQIQQLLTNPQALAALYMHAQSLQQGNQPTGPQPLTTEFLPKLEQSFEKKLQDALGKYQAQMSQERDTERMEAELDNFMKGVLQNYPVLKAVDGIEDTIFNRVAALNPSSLEEAKELARTMAENMSIQATKAWEEQSKQAALRKANAQFGIEPKGGQLVFNKPPNVKKLEDLDNSFLAYLQQQDRAGQ